MQKKILITSALPYVNNVPHLGNIIGCVLSADVFSRYCKASGKESIYICGTDEYGTATEIKALEEKVSPAEICAKYYKIHKEIYEWFGIRFDYFGRTSTEKHTRITQDIFNDLHKNGHVIEEEIEQFYDEKAGMFLADRYIEGECPHCHYEGARGDQCDKCGKLLHPTELINPVSKVTKTKPVLRRTRHLFIDLPGIEKVLAPWIERNSVKGFWSENTRRIAKAWLNEGLKKRAITRDLKWGVPVPLPGFESKVFYVWFDAPIGYISITASLTDDWKGWWMNPDGVDLYQFMGKDNVPFHSVIFPSTLMGTGRPWTLVHHISTTEFLNYEGGKFSKSRSVGVFGDDAMRSGIAPDVWRYYLLSNRPEQADTNFIWEDFADKNNSELLANLGNLVNRTLVFIKNNFEGIVPDAEPWEKDQAFLDEQKKTMGEITADLEKVRIKDGLHKIMHLSKSSNKYFQDNKPWELIKSDRERASAVMRILVSQVKDLAILIGPYLPYSSAEIFSQLAMRHEGPGAEMGWNALGTLVPGNHRIGEPKAIFRKIELKEIADLRGRFAGGAKGGSGGGSGKIAATFKDLDLEIGQIISVEKHPNAEKLFVEKVLLGDGERQIVSGLVGHYLPEELVGKKVIIVRNLKPAILRGAESNGMLLAAQGREHAPPKVGKGAGLESGAVEVIFCEHCKVGQKIARAGEQSEPKSILTIDDVRSVKIYVKDFIVMSEGKELVYEGHPLKMKNVREGVVG